MRHSSSIDRRALLTMAVAADIDPRSILHELAADRGERPHVRGTAGIRARRVLAENGLISLEKTA